MIQGHVLLVDDEPALVSVLQPVLKAAGYTVTVAPDGNAAISGVVAHDPDVVLLDLGLPDMDGKEVIRIIRESSTVPIIVISARHQEAEKIAALDEGADDYVNKPFEIGELMARIRAAVRRLQSQAASAAVFEGGDLRVDFGKREVELLGETVKLSPKEYMLLHALARNAGQVVTHKRLLTAGWGNSTSDLQYLRVYIGLLRQKLEENPSEPELIVTEPGVGYRLMVRDPA
ncbi:response regulator transcription factor [Novosphingobium sp. LASN5T]|uniref:response regulator transcription factor n=1 Tax=Novosphingobium sp. LASN5T TaxID=2491021 RepID=UPI000F5F75DB|nr:response regulator transcription factor [Novosphingobium sp. LASN5T]RQW43576.1 DNA-binding response regulator [Novosphingobium sp. LASN5T]